MVNYQTETQKVNSIRFGSAKIEVGEDVGSLVNLGLATGIEFREEYTPIVLKPDNAPELTVGIKEHYATAAFELWEVDLSNLALIRGGIDVLTPVDGDPVSVEGEAHVLNDTGLVRLNYKNGDGSEVASITVTDAGGNAAARNTDYVIGVDSAGFTVIGRVSTSSVILDGEGVLVDYTYTPNASVKLTSGGLNTINPRVVRLTNKNAAGKIFRITIYAAKNQTGITLTLPADDGDDPVRPAVELRGTMDTNRTAGDQLFEIYDEQNVL